MRKLKRIELKFVGFLKKIDFLKMLEDGLLYIGPASHMFLPIEEALYRSKMKRQV